MLLEIGGGILLEEVVGVSAGKATEAEELLVKLSASLRLGSLEVGLKRRS